MVEEKSLPKSGRVNSGVLEDRLVDRVLFLDCIGIVRLIVVGRLVGVGRHDVYSAFVVSLVARSIVNWRVCQCEVHTDIQVGLSNVGAAVLWAISRSRYDVGRRCVGPQICEGGRSISLWSREATAVMEKGKR